MFRPTFKDLQGLGLAFKHIIRINNDESHHTQLMKQNRGCFNTVLLTRVFNNDAKLKKKYLMWII